MSTLHPPPPSVSSFLDAFFTYESFLLSISTSSADSFSSSSLDALIPSYPHTYLNHGADGCPPLTAFLLRSYVTQLCYAQPMLYHRSLVPVLVSRARQACAAYLKIPFKEKDKSAFSFLPSVSQGLFAVLQSVDWCEGDVIVTSDVIYHSLKDAVQHLANLHRLDWIVVATPARPTPSTILSAFTSAIDSVLSTSTPPKIKLCAFDHVSSKPSILFPASSICSLCKERNIPTLVDGAHVPGALPSSLIDVPSLGATFYAVTFHKWCGTLRAAGGLYVNSGDIEDPGLGFEEYVDVSRVAAVGGRAEGEAGSGMYLDAGKPGYLTDTLTQGIYDESTREYENIIILPHCLELVKQKEPSFLMEVKAFRSRAMEVWRQAFGYTKEDVEVWGGVADEHEGGSHVSLPMLSLMLPTSRLMKAMECGGDIRRLKKELNLRLWEVYAIEVPVFVWKENVAVRISYGRDVTVDSVKRYGTASCEAVVYLICS